ncbi:MAG: DnaJ domain-containing protein [Methyloceanibacter sp.]
MTYFLAGCAFLALLLLAARLLVRADPQSLAFGLRKAGGIAVLALAGFLMLRGAIPIAIPLAAFGLALLGGRGVFGGFAGSAQRSPGQKSHVRTERLEMELDHDSGRMDGTCLAGSFAGRRLSSLSEREVLDLYQEFDTDRFKEAALLEAYLDWRVSGWREQVERRKAEGAWQRSPAGGHMSAEEARAVLGVAVGTSEAAIRQAHRKLMMKLHPDQGGSTYLAARINEAKEVLLGRK